MPLRKMFTIEWHVLYCHMGTATASASGEEIWSGRRYRDCNRIPFLSLLHLLKLKPLEEHQDEKSLLWEAHMYSPLAKDKTT